MERKNALTFKGNPLTLLGRELRSGDAAPDFTVLSADLKPAGLHDFQGLVKVIASVPSLDTPVCDLEIKRFNEAAAGLSEGIVIISVSMDLPFALKRFCQSNDIERVKTYSDHRDANFGTAYGVLIKELRLLSRAVFVVDKTDTVRYVEYVPELSTHPHYETVLGVLKTITG